MGDEFTTIAVRHATKELVDSLKQEWKARSFDDTIRKMAIQAKKPKRTLFGSLKGNWPEFRREEIDRIN
jgi:hypothetical protein